MLETARCRPRRAIADTACRSARAPCRPPAPAGERRTEARSAGKAGYLVVVPMEASTYRHGSKTDTNRGSGGFGTRSAFSRLFLTIPGRSARIRRHLRSDKNVEVAAGRHNHVASHRTIIGPGGAGRRQPRPGNLAGGRRADKNVTSS